MPTATKGEVISYDINVPYRVIDDTRSKIKYPEHIPSWDKIWFEPFRYLSFRITNITSRLGSYVSGIELNQLNNAARNEITWLVFQRKVLSYQNQGLTDDEPATRQGFMNYFGKPNYQPVSGSIKGQLGFHPHHPARRQQRRTYPIPGSEAYH
ncbi:hypothetical protein AAE478_010079 [Parahypoxylon ruwenzoriense]